MAFKHASNVDSADAGKWEVAGSVIRETPKGVLFNDGAREAWLPKRFVTIHPATRQQPATVVMPEWLAKKEKFI
jgi:RNase P/RNase MRP subunit p29